MNWRNASGIGPLATESNPVRKGRRTGQSHLIEAIVVLVSDPKQGKVIHIMTLTQTSYKREGEREREKESLKESHSTHPPHPLAVTVTSQPTPGTSRTGFSNSLKAASCPTRRKLAPD